MLYLVAPLQGIVAEALKTFVDVEELNDAMFANMIAQRHDVGPRQRRALGKKAHRKYRSNKKKSVRVIMIMN